MQQILTLVPVLRREEAHERTVPWSSTLPRMNCWSFLPWTPKSRPRLVCPVLRTVHLLPNKMHRQLIQWSSANIFVFRRSLCFHRVDFHQVRCCWELTLWMFSSLHLCLGSEVKYCACLVPLASLTELIHAAVETGLKYTLILSLLNSVSFSVKIPSDQVGSVFLQLKRTSGWNLHLQVTTYCSCEPMS